MANNYSGFLLKFGGRVFPNGYFLEYESTPDQRLETDAERDSTGYLNRSTLPNGKTSLSFSTHILNLDEKIAVQSVFRSGLISAVERKYRVTFWDDEINDYKTSDFYMPDVKYQIMDADASTIRYNPITFELTEY